MNIYLNNGELKQVKDLNEYGELIREEMGPDSAEALQELVHGDKNSIKNMQIDLDIQYESTRNLENGLIEARNKTREIIEFVENAKRLNKKELIKYLKELEKMQDTTLLEY